MNKGIEIKIELEDKRVFKMIFSIEQGKKELKKLKENKVKILKVVEFKKEEKIITSIKEI